VAAHRLTALCIIKFLTFVQLIMLKEYALVSLRTTGARFQYQASLCKIYGGKDKNRFFFEYLTL
jgi:hypothetical protein